MRKPLLLSTCVVWVSVLAGCGGNPCEDAKKAGEDLLEKAGECMSAQEKTAAEKQLENELENCEEEFEDAKDDEKEELEKNIEKAVECVDKLDECTEDTAAQWQAELQSCDALLGGGDPCEVAGEASEELIAKGGVCLSAEEKATLEAENVTAVESCRNSYASGTTEQQEAIEAAATAFANCVSELDTCTEATSEAWIAAVQTCSE